MKVRKDKVQVETRRVIDCEAVWQLKELQAEADDVPSPKKKKVLDLFKELK